MKNRTLIAMGVAASALLLLLLVVFNGQIASSPTPSSEPSATERDAAAHIGSAPIIPQPTPALDGSFLGTNGSTWGWTSVPPGLALPDAGTGGTWYQNADGGISPVQAGTRATALDLDLTAGSLLVETANGAFTGPGGYTWTQSNVANNIGGTGYGSGCSTTANFTMPAVGSNVTVSTTAFYGNYFGAIPNGYVYVGGVTDAGAACGLMQIVSGSGASVVLKNTGYAGNASPSATCEGTITWAPTSGNGVGLWFAPIAGDYHNGSRTLPSWWLPFSQVPALAGLSWGTPLRIYLSYSVSYWSGNFDSVVTAVDTGVGFLIQPGYISKLGYNGGQAATAAFHVNSADVQNVALATVALTGSEITDIPNGLLGGAFGLYSAAAYSSGWPTFASAQPRENTAANTASTMTLSGSSFYQYVDAGATPMTWGVTIGAHSAFAGSTPISVILTRVRIDYSPGN